MSSDGFHTDIDFRQVFETSREVCALVAADPPDFTILAVSDGYTRITMRPRQDLVGRKIFELFPENPEAPPGQSGPDSIRASFERVIREKRADSIGVLRYDVPDPDVPDRFEERYFSPRNQPVLGEDGEVLYILLWVEEVTDFVLRERFKPQVTPTELPAGKRLLVAEADPEHRRYLEELFAPQWEVVAVGSARDALAEIERQGPDLVLAARELPDTGGDELIRTLRSREDTAELPVILALASTNPLQFREGFQAGADEVVSGQVPAGELMARAEARVAITELRRTLPQQTAERFRQLFMQAPVGIALMEGPEHIITLSNPAHDEIAGSRPLIGLPVREAFPEAGLQTFFDRMDDVYGKGEPFFINEVPVEQQVPGESETFTTYVSFAYLPVPNLHGGTSGVATFVTDVTPGVEARKEVERETARKDEFLSLLGHELRNPLTPIATAAQLLEMHNGHLDPGRLEQVSTTLSRQVTHLTRLVDDLLDISRIDRGQITLQEETVDLREVVSQAVEAVPALHEEGAFDFATVLPDGPLTVRGDPVRLAQILSNLLDNAAKYTPRGGWIRLEATGENDQAVLRVRDNGAGIDPDFLPRVFESFARGPDRDTRTMGLGLGLPLARRLVELHGGTLEAASPGPDQGSTFTVRLPVREAPAETEEPEAAEEPAPSGRILMVEDNEDVAAALHFLLETLDQEVHHVATGEEAIAAVQSFRPALVLIDIGLPDMSGFEVAGRLRESLGSTPLVALSGHPASHFPNQPTEVFDDYLLKPPTLEGLKEALGRMA